VTRGPIEPSVDVWVFRGPSLDSTDVVERVLRAYPNPDGHPPAHNRDAHGRRVVADREELSLSTSHTDGIVAVAIGSHCRAGIDVEAVRERSILRLPDHVLTTRERHQLSCVDDALRFTTFLAYWTRKEALLKAAGVGLAVEPSLIELPAVGITGVIAVADCLRPALRWFVANVDIDGCIAAVAADVPSPRLRFRRVRPGSGD